MIPCVCGCPMHGGMCPHCGCSIYEPDNGRDASDPHWFSFDRFEARYGPADFGGRR